MVANLNSQTAVAVAPLLKNADCFERSIDVEIKSERKTFENFCSFIFLANRLSVACLHDENRDSCTILSA